VKEILEALLLEALNSLKQSAVLPADVDPRIEVSRTRDAAHGDFATNLAMTLAKPAGMNPRVVAEALIDALPSTDRIDKIEIAGPGFINFFVASAELHAVIPAIHQAMDNFGRSDAGSGVRVQVEFVSANPTGPLHVGHGRGAATGAAIANLLAAAGYEVQREYYVNDAGRQMDILATSVWLRYLELCGEIFDFPVNGYQGNYLYEISRQLKKSVGVQLVHPVTAVFNQVPDDEPAGGDKEAHIDGLIRQTRSLLGAENYALVFNRSLEVILEDIQEDLSEFGVRYDNWFSERRLTPDIGVVVEKLKESGHMYQKDGAWWFRSTDFGDEKDRVVVRENGQSTYFASDIAYLMNKLDRGFDHILYVFGADHHGYVNRMLAACDALGQDRNRIEFILIQFARLFRSGVPQQMSTRSGEFVTIRELRDEVGKDAARYFYVMRRYQQHLEFDLDLAKSQTRDNPVYYVQYAHARICSVERQARDKGFKTDLEFSFTQLGLLTETQEAELMKLMQTYPEIVTRAAVNREPHQLTTYLQELANTLNKYYEAHKWLVDNEALRQARMCLILAARQVLKNGLLLLDVSAPEVL